MTWDCVCECKDGRWGYPADGECEQGSDLAILDFLIRIMRLPLDT